MKKITSIIILILCFLSTKAQDFWEEISVPENDTFYIRDVFVASNNYIYLGGNDIYRSKDNCQTWELVNFHGSADFTKNSQGYITGLNLELTIDNGDTWTEIGEDFTGGLTFFASDGTLFLSSSYGSEPYSIFKTTDYGQNWVLLYSYSADHDKFITDFTETSNGYLFACTNDWDYISTGIYRSMDYGNTWDYTHLAINTFSTIKVNSKDEIFAVNYYEGIFKSSDYGETWVHLDINASIADMVIDSEDNIYIGCDWEGGPPGIFKSSDNGETWVTLNSGLQQYPYVSKLVISPTGFLYCISSHLLYRSVLPVTTIVEEQNKNIYFDIYPNPVSNVLNINFNDKHFNGILNIYNTQGQIVDKILLNNQKKCQYSVSNLNTGIYFIEMKTSKKLITKKIIVY